MLNMTNKELVESVKSDPEQAAHREKRTVS